FDRSREGAIREAITALRDFNKNVLVTNGNAGTLDALNRGEIAMGAVWIDQLVAWKNEGRMDPSITPVLPAPGLPIYPLYLVVPREAAGREAAVRHIDYIATPEVQARAIVERFGLGALSARRVLEARGGGGGGGGVVRARHPHVRLVARPRVRSAGVPAQGAALRAVRAGGPRPARVPLAVGALPRGLVDRHRGG